MGAEQGMRAEVLRDLQRELSLAAKDLGGGDGISKDREDSSEDGEGGDTMAALLELYSSKLLGIVNERLNERSGRRGELLPPVTIDETPATPEEDEEEEETIPGDWGDETDADMDRARRKCGGSLVMVGEG